MILDVYAYLIDTASILDGVNNGGGGGGDCKLGE